MDLFFLGTGGSFPSRDRSVTALVVKHDKTQILIDCGEGTQRQFMQSEASFMKTGFILLSHFHGDHFLGLPGLLQTMSLNNRTDPLEILGPEGTVEIVENIVNLGHFTPGFPISGKDLTPGESLVLGDLTLTVAEADHSVPTLAFRLETVSRPGKFNKKRALELGVPEGPAFSKLLRGDSVEVDGRTIKPDEVIGPERKGLSMVFSGDTRPTNTITELAKGVNVLIHEATSLSDIEEKMNEWGHTSARQAAEIAKEAGAGQLILFHLSPRYEDAEGHLNEARAVFENTIVPEDLDRISVSFAI